jgi:Recombination endonuclease VII
MVGMMDKSIIDLFEGLEYETKRCNQCGVDKPLFSYTKNSGANHLRAKCKDCEKLTTAQRNKFKNLFPPKNHICPICKRTEEKCAGEGGKKVGTWCCDHNHITGEFRGWLCHSCNRALGNFKDNVILLKSALEYLSGTND